MLWDLLVTLLLALDVSSKYCILFEMSEPFSQIMVLHIVFLRYCPNFYFIILFKYCKLLCRFIDLDTPLLLSEDPVLEGYQGIYPNTLLVLLYRFSWKAWLEILMSLQSDETEAFH